MTSPDTDWCSLLELICALLAIGLGVRHAWLHDDCWAPWRERRRTDVVTMLAGRELPRSSEAQSGRIT